MFKLHLGDTKSTLTEADYRILGEKSDNYSGADIQVVVRDALMQPIRRVQHATHFKPVSFLLFCFDDSARLDFSESWMTLELRQSQRLNRDLFQFDQVSAPDRTTGEMRHDFLTPCSPGDPAAMEMNWMDMDPDRLFEPPVSMRDMMSSLEKSKPSVNQDDVEKMAAFTRDFGQEGWVES